MSSATDSPHQPADGPDARRQQTRGRGHTDSRRKIGAGAWLMMPGPSPRRPGKPRWERPSFAKGLYLGSFDLSLIHPWPAPEPRTWNAAKRSWPGSPPLPDHVRPGDRARRQDSGRIPPGAGGPGRLRHEDPAGVRRPGAVPGVLRPGAGTAGLGAPQPRRTALRPPVHRRARAGEGVRHRGTETGVPAPLRRRRHHRVPADRTRRRQRPRPDGQHRRPHGRRRGVRSGRRETLDHQRRDRRTGGGHGRGAARTRIPTAPSTRAASAPSWWRWTPPASRWKTATRSWACAASRTA